MVLVYLALILSAKGHYYVGYEKLRGTYIVVGVPPFAHRAAYAINAPATAIAMLILRIRGRITGLQEAITIGVLSPVLWYFVGAFLDRAFRTMRPLVRAAILSFLAILFITPIVIDAVRSSDAGATRYLTGVWIVFAIWVLFERARWRKAARPSAPELPSEPQITP